MLMELLGITKSYVLGRSGWTPFGAQRQLTVVDNVSLDIRKGEVLGLVGESGSGKSTLSSIAIRLTRPDSGRIVYKGQDVTLLGRTALRAFRSQVQMVFQDSTSSLNPRKSIGRTLSEALAMRGVPRSARPVRALRLLDQVGLGPRFLSHYPHQMSGGQRQRVSIARALAMEPELLIADEPVASLDVSLQAQIVNLLLDLRDELGLTILFISHDLALVAQISDRIAIMQHGKLLDLGTPAQVFRTQAHPYTAQLLAAVPRPRFDEGPENGRIRERTIAS